MASQPCGGTIANKSTQCVHSHLISYFLYLNHNYIISYFISTKINHLMLTLIIQASANCTNDRAVLKLHNPNVVRVKTYFLCEVLTGRRVGDVITCCIRFRSQPTSLTARRCLHVHVNHDSSIRVTRSSLLFLSQFVELAHAMSDHVSRLVQ